MARLHGRAFAQDRGWSAAEFAGLVGQPGVIATGDARGFALGRVIHDEAEVLTLATDPAHRRQGLARACLAALEAAAGTIGASVIFLEVAEDNAAAHGLYAAAGYLPSGRRPGYYARPDGAVAALVLRKLLAMV